MKKGLITLIAGTLFTSLCLYGCQKTETVDSIQPVETSEDTEAADGEIKADDNTLENAESAEEETEPADNAPDYEGKIDAILASYYEAMENGVSEEDIYDDLVPAGLSELIMGYSYMDTDQSEALNDVGYLTDDLNGDGIPELLIGMIFPNEYSEASGNEILALYAWSGDDYVLLAEGHSRDRWFILDNGNFFNIGSGGAMYTLMGTYELEKNSSELKCVDFYLTDFISDDGDEIGVYTNNSGSEDKTDSTLTDMTPEELYGMEGEYEKKTEYISFTSFKEYKNPMKITYLESYEGDKPVEHWENLGGTDNDCHLVLSAKSELKNISVLSLEFVDVDEEGKVKFNRKELYHQDKLMPEAPLGIDVTMIGEIPNIGISYEDTEGNKYEYSIGISGYDGSLELIEF